MIHSSTRVQCLDINTGEPLYGTIEQIFQKYSHLIEEVSMNGYCNNILKINFDNRNFKITDLFGWTDVITIYRIMDYYQWSNINLDNNDIIVSSNELIPIYNKDKNKIGFHGEVKYNYILTNPAKIKNGYIRVNNGEDDQGNPIEFLIPKKINNSDEYIKSNGYMIITKSRFYNGNNIHLFGSNQVTMEEMSNWYK